MLGPVLALIATVTLDFLRWQEQQQERTEVL